MLFQYVLLGVAQIATVAAYGQVTVANRCNKPAWIWSVDGTGSSRAIKVEARSRYNEPIRSPCADCGVSIKVSRTEQLIGGQHTQFEYSIKDQMLYYDISFVDCAKGNDASACPGHIAGLEIYSSNEPQKCPRVTCLGNGYCPEKAYYVDTPVSKLGLAEPVFGCDAGDHADLVFVLCQNQRHV